MIEPTKWRPIAIAELESAAWEVVRSQSSTAVIAGPGAGKTELLAQRACYLLQTGIVRPPGRILAISFKRDAAKNLRDRVSQRCNPQDATRFDSITFDAFAKNLLDRFYPALPERWRPTSDYQILHTSLRVFRNFLDGLSQPSLRRKAQAELQAIPRDSFEKRTVVGSPLPEGGLVVVDAATWAASIWWKQQLHGDDRSNLSFPMIGRLVELLIRTNPRIQQALRATYSHVFLDEFQDTTHVQYELVKTIFGSSDCVLTAVGDKKQQIMRWAMALDDPFSMFECDFNAKSANLISNHRSSPELVRIQHQIALAVDPSAQPAESQSTEESPADTCVILEFSTEEAEARHLARFVDSEISCGDLEPRDFSILVRQKAAEYASVLEPMFHHQGIKLRDEGEIQDILAERLTAVLISFLRLGSLPQAGEHWTRCTQITSNLKGLDPHNEVEGRHLQQALGALHTSLRRAMEDPPSSPNNLRQIIDTIVEFLGEDNIKLVFPEYGQGGWFDVVVEQVITYVYKSCEDATDWPLILDDFEGRHSLPLMTIHKSKGLEYHTVIFLALDDKAWWSFRWEPEDARAAFFVAFSRAKQKVIFTYCQARARRTEIASLYELLRSAGVPSRFVA